MTHLTPDEVIARLAYPHPTSRESARRHLTNMAEASLAVVDATDTPNEDESQLIAALELIDKHGCHTYVAGTRCLDPGTRQTRGAEYSADAWCDACIARDALDWTGGSPGGSGTDDDSTRHAATPECVWSDVDPAWCNTHARYFRCPASTSGMCLELVESGKPCPAGECDRTPGGSGTAYPTPRGPFNSTSGDGLPGGSGTTQETSAPGPFASDEKTDAYKAAELRRDFGVTQETSADPLDLLQQSIQQIEREPQPTDGPDYYAGYQAWQERQIAHWREAAKAAGRVLIELKAALPFPNAHPGPQVDGQPTWGAYLRDVPDEGYEHVPGTNNFLLVREAGATELVPLHEALGRRIPRDPPGATITKVVIEGPHKTHVHRECEGFAGQLYMQDHGSLHDTGMVEVLVENEETET